MSQNFHRCFTVLELFFNFFVPFLGHPVKISRYHCQFVFLSQNKVYAVILKQYCQDTWFLQFSEEILQLSEDYLSSCTQVYSFEGNPMYHPSGVSLKFLTYSVPKCFCGSRKTLEKKANFSNQLNNS